MAITISQLARETGVINPPKIGLLVMGRKRPGFDPDWGAEVKRKINEAVAALPWEVITPSENIADESELKRAVGELRAAEATTAVVVQPTISDGRLAPMLSRLWDKPLLLWATTEKPTGAMISANSLVGTHVMAATLRQLGHPLELVYGHPEDTELRARLRQAIVAVHAADAVRGRKFGLVGAHAPGFVDFHADPVFLNDELDSQLYHLGSIELIQRVRSYSDEEVAPELAEMVELGIPLGETFTRGEGVSPDGSEELLMQALYYRAFRELFEEEELDLLAFRCWPDLPSELGHWPYLALARLVSEGFPIAMEGDVDGALSSLIAESAGLGPVYLSDWLAHDAETITIWHTGAAPFQLCEPVDTDGGPRLSVQFNNKKPTVVDATIRAGIEATAFRIWRFDGSYHMTALEGETVEPTRPLMATNGLFRVDGGGVAGGGAVAHDGAGPGTNAPAAAALDVRDWFEEMVQLGMPHHLAIVPGRHADTLRRIARLIGAVWV